MSLKVCNVFCVVCYTLHPMARRPTKLQVYDHALACPYCCADLVFPSFMEKIFAARRTCPNCKNEGERDSVLKLNTIPL